MRRVMPLCTIDEIRQELADTNRSLLRLGEMYPIVDRERAEERKATLIKWRRLLERQLADMEAEEAA